MNEEPTVSASVLLKEPSRFKDWLLTLPCASRIRWACTATLPVASLFAGLAGS